MGSKRSSVLSGIALILLSPTIGFGQEAPRWYGGGMLGVSTLSADAEHVVSSESLVVSLYKPENGPAANLLVGLHLTDYVTLQVNYIWNRNDLTLVSTRVEEGEVAFYEQARDST